MNRRAALGVLGTAGLSAAGCCPLATKPSSAYCEVPTSLALAPPRSKRVGELGLVVDTHVHIFNATDVAVSGFLKGPVAHGASSPIKELIRLAAPLLERIGHDLPLLAREELGDLCELDARAQRDGALEGATAARRVFEKDFDEYRSRLADQVARVLRGTEFKAAYERASRTISPAAKGASSPVDLGSRQSIEAFFRDETARRKATAAGSRVADHPDGVIAFLFLYMLSPRRHNLMAFQGAFCGGTSPAPVDLCLASMVDFDYWLGCDYTPSNLRDLALVHERLSHLSNGFLLPLVPYNPWTDIERSNESLELVRWAVKDHGFVGVKIYPPMGFRPYGNQPVSSPKKRPPDDKLDEKLNRLFEVCLELDIPVMAHANQSMGRDHAHDELGGAPGWIAALRRHPNLRVNLAHFGGDVGSWNATFAHEVMSQGPHVFGDLGYRMQLAAGGQEADEFRGLLTHGVGPGETVADRVMYGSDWHMISREREWSGYATNMISTVRAMAPPSVANKILGGNAVRCFGFGRNGGNRKRIEDSYRRRGASFPEWLSKAL